MEDATSMAQSLSGKCAVIFGASGSIGAAVAKEIAAEGAEVFLSGRTESAVAEVANQIKMNGGTAHATSLDTTVEASVNSYIDAIVDEAHKIDILLDVSGPLAAHYGNGKRSVELSVEEFMLPLTTMVRSRFITSRAGARHMIKEQSGVIILITGSPARGHTPGASAIGAAFGAIENFVENLAYEISPLGVRVVCIRTVANVDSRTIQDTMSLAASRLNIPKDEISARYAQANLLKKPASVQDTANAVVMVASNRGRMLTGTTINATAGATLD
jgi:NAD(P)-dependent dehydrogenase (short-subunit alcohol dehydrogenase family)